MDSKVHDLFHNHQKPIGNTVRQKKKRDVREVVRDANKSGLCRQVVSIHRFHTSMQSDTYKGSGHWNQKNHNMKKAKWVLFFAWALLGLPPTFFQWTSRKKKRLRIVRWSLYAGKTGWWCMKNPVAGRTRQVVAIRSAVSVWNPPCTKKRSLEAGGRYSWRSLKLGFTVP